MKADEIRKRLLDMDIAAAVGEGQGGGIAWRFLQLELATEAVAQLAEIAASLKNVAESQRALAFKLGAMIQPE